MIRVDDFPQGEPERRFPAYGERLLSRLEERGESYYLAVVPLICTPEDFAFLRTLRYATITMHGLTHGLERWRPPCEFIDLSRDALYTKFADAARTLADFNPVVFVPPFNRFTQDLLDVLAEYHYSTITGGPESYSQMNMAGLNFHDLRFVPSLEPYYTSNGDFQEIVSGARLCPQDQMVTLHLTGDYT